MSSNKTIRATQNGSVQVNGQIYDSVDTSTKIATCAFVKQSTDTLSSTLTTRINRLDTSMNAVDSRITAKFTTIDASFSTVTTNISSLNSSVSTNTSSINSLNTTVGSHTTSINSLNTTVSSHTTSINSNTSSISTINSNITKLDTSMNLLSSVNSDLTQLDVSVNAIESRLTIIDSSLNTISGGSGGSGSGSSGIAVDDVVLQIESSDSIDLPSYGNNWAAIYPSTPEISDLKNIFCSGNGKYVLMGQATGTTPRISKDYGSTWSGITGYTASIVGAALSEDGKYIIVSNQYGGIALNSNFGEGSWTTNVASGTKLAISSTGKYQAGLSTTSIAYSSDFGATWNTYYFGGGETNNGIAMSHDGKRVYVLRKNQLFISTDSCATWSSAVTITQQNNTNGWMPTNYWYEDIACSGDGKIVIFIPARAGSGYNMVISRDYCSTFSVTSSGVYFGEAVISSCGRYITAGIRRDTGGYNTDGVYFSDDYGATWTQTSNALGAIVKAGQVYSLATNNTGSIVYACGSVGQGGAYGVFVSKAAGFAGVVSTCIPTNIIPGTMYFEDWTGLLKIWSSSGGGQWITINPPV